MERGGRGGKGRRRERKYGGTGREGRSRGGRDTRGLGGWEYTLRMWYIFHPQIKRPGILEQHVFLVLELQETLTVYMDKRKVVLKVY